MAYFEKINLEKDMYRVAGKSFTQVLEELDSSKNYVGTELEKLDAYQRQLKRFNIKVAGEASDPVESFFATTQSAALFPEYVSRSIKQGMEQVNRLPEMVATVTKIDSMDYRSIHSDLTDDEKALSVVTEGATIPETTVSTAENLVTLKKRGRLLKASYEALRYQKIDLFTVTLRQIGAHIATSQMKDAVDVLTLGDGNSNPLTSKTLTAALTYGDIVGLWGDLSPFSLNTIIAGTDMIKTLMQIAEFKDANAGLNFHGSGKLATPLGANVIHIPSMAAKTLIGLDKTCALEMVQAGPVLIEHDKLIDRQLEMSTISTIAGFAKIYKDAAKGLKTP